MDPLVIDLDGDGIELTSLDGSAACFDMDNDGFAEQTGWVGADDALLAVDSNGNGKIDDITELFGSENQSGYAALAEYDLNGDGVVDAQDAGFSSLLLWKDLDGDGRTDDGELFSLADFGIASIPVTPTATNTGNNGNTITETGTVAFDDGSTTTSADVDFSISQVNSVYIKPDGFTYDTEVFNLPFLQGMGDIPDLWVEMTQDATLKTDVNNLIAEARAGNFSGFASDFEGMLSNWADTEDALWMNEVPSINVIFAFDAYFV